MENHFDSINYAPFGSVGQMQDLHEWVSEVGKCKENDVITAEVKAIGKVEEVSRETESDF